MNDIYKDIAVRTGGDILIGVVGPVRSGKSTFITKFMNELVIPNIVGEAKKNIAVDELPQSAQGKTVMTTEPKFVPGEAVAIKLDNAQARIRLIDCVGYMVDGAVGLEEDGSPRLVKTPWNEREMTFEEASAYGTEKVISDHSTVGIVVTADGSFTDIERAAYMAAEEKVVNQLKSLNKPFIVLFNTTDPTSEGALATCAALEKKYGVAVLPVKVTDLDKKSVIDIFSRLLSEFPIRTMNFDLPRWIRALPAENKIVTYAIEKIKAAANKAVRMKDYKTVEHIFENGGYFGEATEVNLDMAEGAVTLDFPAEKDVFFNVLSDECGDQITDDLSLLSFVRELKVAKDSYGAIKSALEMAVATGYGIMPADITGAEMGEPRVIRKNGQYCVKISVDGTSLHLIKADVHADVEVVSGSKDQCDAFAQKVSGEDGVRQTEVFGRTVYSMLEENLSQKSDAMHENVKSRLKRAVNKAVNEKKTNMICILL